MPNEGQRPLHRLTPLLEDPAAAWLSAAGRWRVGLTGVLGWGAFIPGVLETLHDFDLVDETGRSIPIQVADARMLGEPTVDLGGGDSQHVLIASLDLPAGANPSGWQAFVLRDGDPLLIVGFRKSMVDPNEHGLRQAPVRAGVASSPPRPLLIFPIDAERRVSSGWG